MLDSAAWARTGTTGPTVGEALTTAGHKLRRADKNRIQGKIQVHERLKLNGKGRPRLQIFKTCPNLIREIQSIPLDPNKPEDVDTKAQDHAYDALRYLIMSRPRTISSYEHMQQIKSGLHLTQHLDINMRDTIKEALIKHAEGHIEKHKTNIEVYLNQSVGIGEHSDIVESIEKN